MHTVVTQRSSQEQPRQHHRSHSAITQHTAPARRVGLVDRVALHVGVALITWGRRPILVESRERRANRVEQHLATLERELAAERMHHLIAPRS